MAVQNVFTEPLSDCWVSGVSVDWLEWSFIEKPYVSYLDQLPTAASYAAAFGPDADPGADWQDDNNRQFWTVHDVFSFLGDLGENPAEAEKGSLGYRRKAITAAGVLVLWDGSPGMGVHVSIPGSVVQTLPDVPELVRNILDSGGKFSRLDIAIDDHENTLSLPRLHRKCRQGECVSRVKEWRFMESGTIKDGSITGRTLYFGARESDFMCRIYDKLQEMRKKLKRDKKALAKLPKHWNRCEAELKGIAARNAAAMLARTNKPAAEVLPEIGKGLIKNYINFKTRWRFNKKTGKTEFIRDSNRGRWEDAPFWARWIGSVDRVRVARQIDQKTIEQTLSWVASQCSKGLYKAMVTVGPEAMTEIFKHGRTSMTYRDNVAVYLYQMKQYRKQVKQLKLENREDEIKTIDRPKKPKKPLSEKQLKEARKTKPGGVDYSPF